MSANLPETAEMSRNKMDSRFHGNDGPTSRNDRLQSLSHNDGSKKGGRPGIWASEELKAAASGMLRAAASQTTIARELQEIFGVTVSTSQIGRLAKELKGKNAKEGKDIHHRDTKDTERAEMAGGTPTALKRKGREQRRPHGPIATAAFCESKESGLPPVAPDEALHYTRNPDGSVEISVREPEIVTTYPGDGSVEISMAHPFPKFNPHPAFHNVKNKLVAALTLRPDVPETVKEMLTQQPAGRCAFGVTQSKYSCFHRQVLSGIKRKVRGHKGALMLNAMYLGCKGCGNFLTEEEYDWVITALNEARKANNNEAAA
jgi:hypothetical protein